MYCFVNIILFDFKILATYCQDSKHKKHATIVMDEFQLLISFNFILSQEIYKRKTLLAWKLNMVSSHVNKRGYSEKSIKSIL